MDFLILGGTDFVGRHVVGAALARGHRVTIFHRGRTNPDLFAGAVERRIGDRAGSLEALARGRWERVIDTSGYLPEAVRASTGLLADRAAHYTFVSTLSVYADPLKPGTHEASPVHAPLDATDAKLSPETYGPLKVSCERVVEESFEGRALVVRLGLMVGPHDNVPRLPYWVGRFARGGRVLAPGSPDRLAQLVDARDVADWTVTMAERGESGVFNATGDPGALTLGRVLDACREVTGATAEPVWASDEVLTEEGVPLFDGLPYWIPEPMQGFMRASVERARAAGLLLRPVEETVRDVWSWLESEPPVTPPLESRTAGLSIRCGLAPEMEARILARTDGSPSEQGDR